MGELFVSGRIVDLILGFTALEGIALVTYHRMTRRGLDSAEVLSMLLPGVCLLLALRFSMTGAWWGWIATSLFASLVTHLADLGRRHARTGVQ